MNEAIQILDHQALNLSEGWRAILSENELSLEDPAKGNTLQILRSEANQRIERMNLTRKSPSFYAHIPKPKQFSINEEDAKCLLEWLGPETYFEARHQLKRKVGLNIPMGIFYLLTAFSNLWFWVTGCVLLCTGLLFKYRPRVWLFLLDGFFWLLIMLYQGFVFSRAPGWWSGTFFVLNGYWLFQSVRLFQRFNKHDLAQA